MLRKFSVFTISGSQVAQVLRKEKVNIESLRFLHHLLAHRSDRNDFDATRQVATEHVRNIWGISRSTALALLYLVDSVRVIALLCSKVTCLHLKCGFF